MNKSLLVALAIMPTLLVGCKKDTKLQTIAFETPKLIYEENKAKTVELDPKPSNIKIKFDDIKWTATLDGDDCSEELKTYYMGLKDAGYPAQTKGGIVIEFEPKGKFLKLDSKKILEITATYKDKSASIEAQCDLKTY